MTLNDLETQLFTLFMGMFLLVGNTFIGSKINRFVSFGHFVHEFTPGPGRGWGRKRGDFQGFPTRVELQQIYT